jgi:hypothetical protein
MQIGRSAPGARRDYVEPGNLRNRRRRVAYGDGEGNVGSRAIVCPFSYRYCTRLIKRWIGRLLSDSIFQTVPSRTHTNVKVAEPFEFSMGPAASQSKMPSALHSDVVAANQGIGRRQLGRPQSMGRINVAA